MTEEEYILTGGNTSRQVVRLGLTVRKPVTIATPSVKTLLDFLSDNGYPASPRHFGLDEQGRQMLEFVPGGAGNARQALSLLDLEKVGILIRRLHDLTAQFPIPIDATWNSQRSPGIPDLICHNDLAPWNLIRGESRWVFIDWDNSGPGTRLWDVAYAALTFTPVELKGDIAEMALRIRALIRGYGLSLQLCRALPAMMTKRAQAMADYPADGAAKGLESLLHLDAAGHTHYWAGAAKFIEEHSEVLGIVCCESSRHDDT